MSINSKMTQKTIKKLQSIAGSKLTFGKLILSIRQGEELTQVEFAKLLGMSRQQLCDIEHDRKSISPKLAAQYAQKLQYSEEQFVRLCLQDMLDKSGVQLNVEVTAKNSSSIIDDDAVFA